MIENISASKIAPYDRNPRLNSKTIVALEEIIREYGFLVPLTVTTDYTIVTGHSRYEAGLRLGMSEFPCIVLDVPEDKSRTYRLLDNKIQEYSITDYMRAESELIAISEGDDFFKEMFNLGELTKDDVILETGTIEESSMSEITDTDEDVTVELICPYCFHQWTEIDN